MRWNWQQLAVAIEAQRRAYGLIAFLIDKTRLLDGLKGQLNDRQEKALLRVLREGGLSGGQLYRDHGRLDGNGNPGSGGSGREGRTGSGRRAAACAVSRQYSAQAGRAGGD